MVSAQLKKAESFMSSANGEKVHKILADCGCGSRRAAEELIRQGRVSINRKVAVIGARARKGDLLAVDGKIVHRPTATTPRMICYHKPTGKIVERGAANSVFADLPAAGGGRWINIGRLDVNSEGLLLFCTDGAIAERLAHPRHMARREYLARVDGELSSKQMEEVRRGVVIGGKILRPLSFAEHTSSGGRNRWYRVALAEGRNRAVRKLFEYFGLETARLIRVQMGTYRLPRDLPVGEWREVPPPANE